MIKKIIFTILILFLGRSCSFASVLNKKVYSYNPNTGKAYFNQNNAFFSPSSKRGTEVQEKPYESEFSYYTDEKPLIDLDGFSFDTGVSTRDMLVEGSSGDRFNNSFYTSETKVSKRIADNLEMYGSVVLGASPYVLNNTNGIYDSRDRVAAFASPRGGLKYNVSDGLGIILESQYNLTGELADSTGMMDGLNGAQYRSSNIVKTGFEWKF